MVNHKCENCGGNLKLNRITGLYKCTSCGSEFSLESDNVQPEKVFLNAGEEFLDLKDFDKAFESFDTACKLSPNNARCWLGMVKAKTKMFAKLNADNFKDVEEYMRNAEKYLTDDERKSVSNDLKEYKNLKENFLQWEKSKRNSERFSQILKYSIFVVFVVTVIMNLVFAINSKSEFIWKTVGFVIILVIDVALFKIVSILVNLVKPKKKWHYWLTGIILVLVLAMLLCFDMGFAKSI